MANDLVLVERALTPLVPQFAEVLGRIMPPERLVRTVVISCERTPKIMDCNMQSIINSAMSAACLGLEVDGVTGQAFLIPFGGKAQLVIGYKGMSTIAARSGFTVTGKTVREGDLFEYQLGSGAFVKHVPKLGNAGRIIATWACAESRSQPSIIDVLSIDEIMAIKNKSPGGKKSDSPWNDPSIGFPAMAEKSAKRRLGRSMPLNAMQLAARFDEAYEEQGRHAWITPDKGLILGEVNPLPDRQDVNQTPSADNLTTRGQPDPMHDALVIESKNGMAALEKAWMALEKIDRVRLANKLPDLKAEAAKADDAGLRTGNASPEIILPTKTPVPTDDASYRSYAEGWIANYPDKAAATERWQSGPELTFRGECNVTPETRKHLLALIEAIK